MGLRPAVNDLRLAVILRGAKQPAGFAMLEMELMLRRVRRLPMQPVGRSPAGCVYQHILLHQP
jgi:hypothetical protein